MDPGPHLLANLATASEWAQAFREVPREHFIPDIAWTSRHELIDRHRAPDTWRSAVYSDIPVVTQIEDGATELTNESPWMTPRHTSSSSAPSFVASFLDLLGPYPGDRVLEVGTGTGWSAGLLSHRLGGHNITTVEVDPALAKAAKENLRRAGYHPHVITADGAAGHPAGAPYDRVHATCGVATVPYPWVEQTRPGGVIVAPWMHGVLGGGRKVRLTVSRDRAVGRFHGECAYMMLRAQREPDRPVEGEARERTPVLDPRRVSAAEAGFPVWLAGVLPGVSVSPGNQLPDGTFRIVAWDRVGGSLARADYWPHDDHEGELTQRGPRNLWDDVEAAYLGWVGAGTPGIDRFGMSVDTDGQRVWLDHPDNPV